MSEPMSDERLAEARAWIDSFDPSDGFEPTGVGIARDLLGEVDRLRIELADRARAGGGETREPPWAWSASGGRP